MFRNMKLILASLVLISFATNAVAGPCYTCNTPLGVGGNGYPYYKITADLSYAELNAAACHTVVGYPSGSGPNCRANYDGTSCAFGQVTPATNPVTCNLGVKDLIVPDRGDPSTTCPDCDTDSAPDNLGPVLGRWVKVSRCGAYGQGCG